MQTKIDLFYELIIAIMAINGFKMQEILEIYLENSNIYSYTNLIFKIIIFI